MILRTERLLLRPWRDADREPAAAMMGDPIVRRFFHTTRDRAQSDAWIDRQRAHYDTHGFGVMAVEAPGVAPFIGLVGLATVGPSIPCAPAVEIAWTLDRPFWRRGYASEAARAALDDGFHRLGLPEIVAFTATVNLPSRGVMEALGMRLDEGAEFDHPSVPLGHELCRHVVYRARA